MTLAGVDVLRDDYFNADQLTDDAYARIGRMMMARAARKPTSGALASIADCIALYGEATVRGARAERALHTRRLADPSAWKAYRAAVRAVVASDDKQGLLNCFTEGTRRALVLGSIDGDFMLDAVRLSALATLDKARTSKR